MVRLTSPLDTGRCRFTAGTGHHECDDERRCALVETPRGDQHPPQPGSTPGALTSDRARLLR